MGKGRLLAVLTLVLLSLVLASCKTISISSDYTDDDYTSVALLVRDRAENDAIVNFFISLNEYAETMIPTDYAFLGSYRDEVPGLDKILTDWATSTADYLIPNFDVFQAFIADLFSKVGEVDGRKLLQDEEGSISAFYKGKCTDTMVTDAEEFLKGIDVSSWSKAVIQYDAWVNTRALLYDEELPSFGRTFTDDEIISMLARHLVNRFFDYFTLYEILFRTTPDPNMEIIVTDILGLG